VTAAGSPRRDARTHYSYSHYANRAVAEGFDALRFGGPIGQYLLETQQQLLTEALPAARYRRVLDVGTGTGRAALALASAGADVVGTDASQEMLDVARSRAGAAQLAVTFVPGDAHALPFPDRSFDAAVCLRVIMHTPDWRQCVAELCRVSRSRVVLDFPARSSFAALESGARRILHTFGRSTEPYCVFAERQIEDVCRAHGFRVVASHRQFVLPIALHKAIGSLRFTQKTEGVLATLGARHLLGSPVTMVAER